MDQRWPEVQLHGTRLLNWRWPRHDVDSFAIVQVCNGVVLCDLTVFTMLPDWHCRCGRHSCRCAGSWKQKRQGSVREKEGLDAPAQRHCIAVGVP